MSSTTMNLQQDAIYGKDREPDVHLFFSWILNEDTQVKFTHYEVLRYVDPEGEQPAPCDVTMLLPVKVPFHPLTSADLLYDEFPIHLLQDTEQAAEQPQNQLENYGQQTADQKHHEKSDASPTEPQQGGAAPAPEQVEQHGETSPTDQHNAEPEASKAKDTPPQQDRDGMVHAVRMASEVFDKIVQCQQSGISSWIFTWKPNMKNSQTCVLCGVRSTPCSWSVYHFCG